MQFDQLKRREFITLLSSAVAWLPDWARRAAAQNLPLVGFLSSLSKLQTSHMIEALHRGMSEAGFVDGQNVTIDYRFAEGQYDRLPAFAGELVQRAVSVIVAAGPRRRSRPRLPPRTSRSSLSLASIRL